MGQLTLLSPDPAKRLNAAASLFHAPDPAQLPAVESAIAKESDPAVKHAFEEARGRHPPCKERCRGCGQDRRHRCARGARRRRREVAARCRRGKRLARRQRRGRRRAERHRALAGLVVRRAELLLRPEPRIGVAVGRDRPCHHLRRHGRHQYGPWRDGDARRLHNLCCAAGGDGHSPGPDRFCAGARGPGGLPGQRCRGHRHRAFDHPLSLRPAPGNLARDLRSLAGAPAGDALDLRADQPPGRQPLLDERVDGSRRPGPLPTTGSGSSCSRSRSSHC